jgi:hypothetical protein
MGLTGLEPVTLRLSSACSNQLSYRPARRLSRRILDWRLSIFDLEQPARKRAFLKSEIGNWQSEIENKPTRIRSVALRMHELKRISDIAQVEPLDRDREERCRF